MTEPDQQGRPRWTGETRFDTAELNKPMHWRKPRHVFVCEFSDIALATPEQLRLILDVIEQCPQHCFMFVTKRPLQLLSKRPLDRNGQREKLPKNALLLVTCEHQEELDERGQWALVPGVYHGGLSLEPLLGPIDLSRADGDFSWKELELVIIGCESGPHRRPSKLEWVESIVRQCDDAGVRVFVKQLDLGGRVSRDPSEWPEHLRRRELP